MKKTIRLTILVDNISRHPVLRTEHGWAVWIDSDGHNILFDTGKTDLIQANARELDIQLGHAHAIVISHGHFDHTGGLNRILDSVSKTAIYLHPDALKTRFSCHKDKPVRQIGIGTKTREHLTKDSSRYHLVWTAKPTEIAPGIFVTGPVPRQTNFEDVGGPFFDDASGTVPDTLTDDQALFFDSAEGVVIVLGCAHSGVVNTMHHISQLTNRKGIYAVLGGMHLVSASPDRIERTIEAFRSYNVKRIGLAHCTGTLASQKLMRVFPDRCFNCSAGTKIDFF